MQVFEFHFNPPKDKSDLIFDSFCFEPENLYEKRLGSLYMAGILKNALPQNAKFLDKLARIIKEKYYQLASTSPEKSLKGSLKKTNESLEKIARAGDVSWLGNLNFAVISLRDYELNFTKVGDLKIFLLRKGQMIDIDRNLKLEGIEPFPLKIFGNIVSGKLAENDVILVLTKELFNSFLEEKVLEELSNVHPFNSKKIKQILDQKKERLAKSSGVCLLVALTKEISRQEKGAFQQSKSLKIFSLKEVFAPLFRISRLAAISFRFYFKKPVLKSPSIPEIKLKIPSPKINFQIVFPQKERILNFLPRNNQKIGLILFLLIFLILGSFIFNQLEKKELKLYQMKLSQIQEKVAQAESYLSVGKNNPKIEKKANLLLKESWEEISPLINLASTFPANFATEVITLKNTISENLRQISKLKIVGDIQPIFEFKPREFVPNKMVADAKNLYLFSPYSENIFLLDQKAEGRILTLAKKFQSAVALTDSILFFSKPNQLIGFQEDRFKEPVSLATPYPGFSFTAFSSYQSSLYFLDSQKDEIVKYPYSGDFQWDSPQLWLNKTATDFKSIAVDGSVWLLTKDNTIERYYAGNRQETLNLDIFPYPKNLSKIFTSAQHFYLYLLEPQQKRIILINKSGEIIQQIQSEKFDNLLDFTVSPDGKIIYLLNGLKVYKILL